MNFRFLSYKLDDLATNIQMRKRDFEISPSAKATAYPIRAIRYWWVGWALSQELVHKPDATVVDMGAGLGQMRRYCSGSMSSISPEYPFESQEWIALDKVCEPGLFQASYKRIIECDFDNSLPLESGSVDALICIHVMEHLLHPQFTMSEIARVLAPGGIFLGGSPVAPAAVSFLLHRWLRDKKRRGTTGPNGHINSFCPGDWKNLVSNSGLKLDFLSGSHFMRLSGAAIENSKIWAKLNLAWGGVPSLGSEVYLQAHKDG